MKCTVVIPLGPGHEEAHIAALTSVNIASQDLGPFESVTIKVIDDRKGEMGRSKARNVGVQDVETDWIFFLDADDLMHPNAFSSITDVVTGANFVHAVFGNIYEYKDGLAVWRYQVPEIENYEGLLKFDPYLTLQMGHFVRTEVAKNLPFNEAMNCGEDWDYYLRLWKDYRAVKISDPLMINRRGFHSKGPRSATGKDWTEKVGELIAMARDEKSKV